MKIGVPAEVKNNEHRVGLTPESVKTLCDLGHQLFVQSNAGHVIGFTNQLYELSGAQIVDSAAEIYKLSGSLPQTPPESPARAPVFVQLEQAPRGRRHVF